jgi:5'-nucleotidase
LHKEDIAGIAITELGRRLFTDDYEKRVDPRGKVYYWMAGELIKEPQNANTDIAAVMNNKISITPVTYEMTRTETMSDLNKILCSDNFCEWY